MYVLVPIYELFMQIYMKMAFGIYGIRKIYALNNLCDDGLKDR